MAITSVEETKTITLEIETEHAGTSNWDEI